MARRGVRAEIYLGEYDSIEIESYDRRSAMFEFGPDVVVLLNALPPLRLRYAGETDGREHFAETTARRMAGIWDAIGADSNIDIIQSNLILPYERTYGNFDQLVADSFVSQVQRLNLAISDLARQRARVLVNDVASLAYRVGLDRWMDERLWTVAKSYCSLEHLPLVAQSIVDIVLARVGRLTKCVVVDLDNTLWGGIIGDDGIDGIELDPYDAGEPYHRLQNFLLELKRRGILLAVCSKNDRDTAVEVFRKHPDMVLREEDISVFVANWDPKPDNIAEIRDRLNIGFDAMVFLDDNPVERDLVRQTLPEVIVPELPDDPADYVRTLCALNLFETTSLSSEDRIRTDLYRQNEARSRSRESFTQLDDYLKSLDMQVTMQRFDSFHLPRAAQLLQRSNQFNLTTRRYSVAECEEMMRDEDNTLPLYIRLTDKFGDNGLISVIILRFTEDRLDIDSWLMSCRVLGRGVEHFAMNRVVEIARKRGYSLVRGTYLPTRKNGMVRDFYERFGFRATGELESGGTQWDLDVASYEAHANFLAEKQAASDGENS